jgi:protoheme ferro-lyase
MLCLGHILNRQACHPKLLGPSVLMISAHGLPRFSKRRGWQWLQTIDWNFSIVESTLQFYYQVEWSYQLVQKV